MQIYLNTKPCRNDVSTNGDAKSAGPWEQNLLLFSYIFGQQKNLDHSQGGITCGAMDEPRKSSKAINKRVIIDFCDKNVVIARFRDQNEVFIQLPIDIYIFYFYIFSNSVLSIAILFF